MSDPSTPERASAAVHGLARRAPDRRQRAGREAERRSDEREGAAEIDSRARAGRRHARKTRASATPAAIAVFTKFSMSLFRIPGPSSVAPSALSTSAPTVGADDDRNDQRSKG